MALRFRLQGNNPFTPGSGLVPRVKLVPFVVIQAQTDLTIGITATSLGTLSGTNHNCIIRFRNISTSGQQMRIGSSGVSIGGGIGTLLYPGEEWTITNFDATNGTPTITNAVADAASATLNILSVATLL